MANFSDLIGLVLSIGIMGIVLVVVYLILGELSSVNESLNSSLVDNIDGAINALVGALDLIPTFTSIIVVVGVAVVIIGAVYFLTRGGVG